MWPFRKQKKPSELGDSVDAILAELRSRKHWSRLPDSMFSSVVSNATCTFDRTSEAAEMLRYFVFLMEDLRLLPRLLVSKTSSQEGHVALSELALQFYALASAKARSARVATLHDEMMDSLFVADIAASSSLICDRYSLHSYLFIANQTLSMGDNYDEVRLWCQRYRRAEAALLAEPETSLNSFQLAARELLDSANSKRVAAEMRKNLPLDLIPSTSPNSPASPREMLNLIENQIDAC